MGKVEVVSWPTEKISFSESQGQIFGSEESETEESCANESFTRTDEETLGKLFIYICIYIISQIILEFWLVLTYDLEQIHNGIIKISLLQYKVGRFHVDVRQFSNRSQKTSKCGKNISDTLAKRLVLHFFVLITFWRHLWYTSEETHGNVKAFFKIA